MNNQDYFPCKELQEIFLPAYEPCKHFGDPCARRRWNPIDGHIPRGFTGAFGTLQDVELVIVAWRPAPKVQEDESYTAEVAGNGRVRKPTELMAQACKFTYTCINERREDYHEEIHDVIDSYFGGNDFRQKLRKAFIMQVCLCSKGEPGDESVRTCNNEYLQKALAILKNNSPCTFVHYSPAAERCLRKQVDSIDITSI